MKETKVYVSEEKDDEKENADASSPSSSSSPGADKWKDGEMQLTSSISLNPKVLLLVAGATFIVVITFFNGAGPGGGAGYAPNSGSRVSLKQLLAAGIEAAERGGDEVRIVRKLASTIQTDRVKNSTIDSRANG